MFYLMIFLVVMPIFYIMGILFFFYASRVFKHFDERLKGDKKSKNKEVGDK